jgi:hypothetical protein
MISRMLGAPFGGTTRGGHHGFEWSASSLMTPPNFGGGGGNCFPLIVVVAPGEPGTPVVCCAIVGDEHRHALVTASKKQWFVLISISPVLFTDRYLGQFDSAVPSYYNLITVRARVQIWLQAREQ